MEDKARRYRLWLSFALGTSQARIASLLKAYQGNGEAIFQDARLGLSLIHI